MVEMIWKELGTGNNNLKILHLKSLFSIAKKERAKSVFTEGKCYIKWGKENAIMRLL